MKFIFFSKTMYDEIPRIRHQLAYLLMKFDHQVIFFQKPAFPSVFNNKLINKKIGNDIEIRQTKQLIHHQLRVFDWIIALNSKYESNQIFKSLENIKNNDVIVNFNYDYFFLRRLFPHNKIITIINDDFIAQAKFFNGKHVERSLGLTIKNSDVNLTVSYPLFNQIKNLGGKVNLFLPWTESYYIKPNFEKRSKSILIWASINSVIDFDLIYFLSNSLKDFNFYLIGPLDNTIENTVIRLCENKNIHYHNPVNLEDLLNISNFFMGLMPYKTNVKSTEAVTIANKTFRLMSLGMPLVVHGMPNFFEHPAILKSKTYDEVISNIQYCFENFENLQDDICKLISENTDEVRYNQFINYI